MTLINSLIMHIHIYQIHESSPFHTWDLPFYLTFKLSKELHTMWSSIMLKFICHCNRAETGTLKVSRSWDSVCTTGLCHDLMNRWVTKWEDSKLVIMGSLACCFLHVCFLAMDAFYHKMMQQEHGLSILYCVSSSCIYLLPVTYNSSTLYYSIMEAEKTQKEVNGTC